MFLSLIATAVIHAGTSATGPYVVVDADRREVAPSVLARLKKGSKAKPIAPKKVEPEPEADPEAETDAESSDEIGTIETPIGTITPTSKTKADSAKEDAPPTSRAAKGLSLLYLSSVAQPIAHHAVGFDPAAVAAATTTSPWARTREVKSASFAFILGYRHQRSERLSINPSFSFLRDETVSSKSFPAISNRLSEINVETSAKLWALRTDLRYAFLRSGPWELSGGGGVGLWNSSVDVVAKQNQNGLNDRIADYNSFLYLLSGEVVAAAGYRLGAVMLCMETQASLPLSTLAKGDSGDVDLTRSDFGKASYALKDMRQAVDHRTGLGYGVAVGLTYAF